MKLTDYLPVVLTFVGATGLGATVYIARDALADENQCLKDQLEIIDTLKAVTKKLKEERAAHEQCEAELTEHQDWCVEQIQTLDAHLFISDALNELEDIDAEAAHALVQSRP